jgi:uncharacterized protein
MGRVRNGAWIQTVTGKQFWPMDAQPEEVDIEDIAHALSLLCRFNGHCKQFYSVAEHSIHVSKVVSNENAAWGLLHDAAEAYLSDIPQPVKRELTLFNEFEDRLLEVIAERFGLPKKMPPEVKQVDMVMLATEKVALMGKEPKPWAGLPDPLDPSMIHAWGPKEAKQEFLKRFHELLS